MAKKQLIMDKALELFAKQGFNATSIQQITDHCGISKGAFYLSFKSKDALILAIIDHFMMKYVSSIDYLVRSEDDKDRLLYEFYHLCFDSYYEHSEFAKIFIQEQAHSLNDELIIKMRYYSQLIEESILYMVEKIYGYEVERMKYDLVYCIQGFMKTYSELFFFLNLQVDLDTLCKSLVEKTNLLAAYTTIPFLTKDFVQLMKKPLNEEITTEEMLMLMDRALEEVEGEIERESLTLLKKELRKPSLSRALISGLLENIRHHAECQAIYFKLRHHFSFE
ncbi:TetR/AcrR family transcriptional regulator [Oceanobacillus sp. FSL K6-2867]|uniref:TetR/AcrR family transcriptional regulator n=1 Tax=Oceanobacillus sp. FSL K6-2867 TaxID=2954748 RepID=UPI0030D9DD48